MHGTLRFLYLSHLLYGICVKIFIVNRYISKSYTTSKIILTDNIQNAGSQSGGPWSPGALKFLLWSPEPYHFTDWSPDPFLAVEPGAQRHFARSPEPGARSPEPSIFKFDHSSSQIALIDYCLFVFVCAC